MPSYTLSEIMSIATGNVGRRADIDASTVSRMVNEAYFEVFYATDPQEGEKIAVSSTTTGVQRVELPSDFLEPISAALIYRSGSTADSNHSSYVTLKLTSPEMLDGRNPQPSTVPEEICFFNSWAELYPSPNSAYSFQLRYRNQPEDMVSLTSLPSLSTPWRKAVVLKTEELLWQYLGNPEGVQSAQMRYLEYTSHIETDRARRQKSSQLRTNVQPSWGHGGRRRASGSQRWGSFSSED